MLVHTVAVVYASVYFIGCGDYYISPAYGVKSVLNKKGNVAAEVYVYLVKIVDVLPVTRDIVYLCKTLIVAYLGVDIVACAK